MFLIFYFYPAEIFDISLSGRIADSDLEVSMKTFLGFNEQFNIELIESGASLERKLSGWMILLIVTVGMPLMFAYRSIVQKPSKKE